MSESKAVDMMMKQHSQNEMMAFFNQAGIELSDEFLERFEAYKAGIRFEEDRYLIANPDKIYERMQENGKKMTSMFRQPFEGANQ